MIKDQHFNEYRAKEMTNVSYNVNTYTVAQQSDLKQNGNVLLLIIRLWPTLYDCNSVYIFTGGTKILPVTLYMIETLPHSNEKPNPVISNRSTTFL